MTSAAPAASGERVKALQRELKSRRLKGFLVPHSDEHQNEFLLALGRAAGLAHRLHRLGGRRPSCSTRRPRCSSTAATSLQARAQADPTLFEVLQTPEAKPSRWIAEKLPKGAAVGYDPTLHTVHEIERLTETLGQDRASSSSRSRRNPIDRAVEEPAEAVARSDRAARHRICRASAEDKIRDVQDAAQGGQGRRGAAHHARFDRLAVQYSRRRCPAHAGGADASPSCRRADVLPCSSIRPRSATMCGAICAKSSISPSRRRSTEKLKELGQSGARVRLDPETAPIRFAQLLKAAGAQVVPRRRPVHRSQGDQEHDGDQRRARGASARRRGDGAVPRLARR